MMNDSENLELQVVPALPEKFVEGRDELNFAEFPLGTISERVDPSTKTLVFEDKIFDKAKNELIPRKLTITGSDAYGLPTSTDDEVLLGLIQLSKLQRFQERRVYFSRYQLLQLLRWPVTGQSYDRIDEALNRWIGVTLYYENAWRDKATNEWVDEKFHILERVKIFSQENERTRPKPTAGQGSFEFAASFFVWNDAVFKSFSNGNLKALNYDFVMHLRSSITRRLYRFLDKRFYYSDLVEFELKNLAYEHIGLSRKTPVGDLKRKINMATDELVEKGYLKDIPKKERFRKIRVGHWQVSFERALRPEGESPEPPPLLPEKSAAAPRPEKLLSPVEEKLVGLGVGRDRARKLVTEHDLKFIEEQIEVFGFLVSKNDPKVSVNPAGFLIRSIEQQFKAPKNFVSAAKREAASAEKKKKEEAQKLKEQRKQEREEAKDKERRAAIDNYWTALSPEMKKRAEEMALAAADHFQSSLMERGGPLGAAARRSILDDHALRQLAQG